MNGDSNTSNNLVRSIRGSLKKRPTYMKDLVATTEKKEEGSSSSDMERESQSQHMVITQLNVNDDEI